MGLAASQARFLGLTARKSNVEYKAQQINQQRVALSNEVLGLYGEYNRLDVPVPPVVQDFQKSSYTLDSTYENYQISGFSKIPSGEYEGYYNVTLTWDQDVAKAYTYAARDSVIRAKKRESQTDEEGNEIQGSFSYLSFQLGLDTFIYDESNPEGSTITKITGDYDKYQGLSTIMESLGKTDGTYYMYMRNGVAYYTSEDDLLATQFEQKEGSDELDYYGTYSFDYQGSQKISKNASVIAALTQEANGRLSTIQVISSDDLPELIDHTFSITTSSTDDQAAYADAMNEYNYQKAIYEKEVERINQKTETLQKEDRSLELQLNQLDTEQRAISTEMESVQNVLKDTMEKVFKTFDG